MRPFDLSHLEHCNMKPITVNAFATNNGTRYLYINGKAMREACAASGLFPTVGTPSTAAKVAVVWRSNSSTPTLAIKPTASDAYVDARAVSGAAISAALIEGMRTVHPVEHRDAVSKVIVALHGGAQWADGAPCAAFDVAWRMIEGKAVPVQPAPVDPAPAPAKETDWAGTPVPPPAPTPTPVHTGPSALASFGALGDAIRADIVAAVTVAVASAPAPTATVVQITVPGYTPVTLPDGEVTHSRFASLLTRCTAQKPKDRNVLLVGPRGSGKTHAAEQVARSLGLAFDAVSMSGGTTERAFWGSTIIRDGNMVWKPSRFVDMFAKGGVFLIDELDKADPTVVTALNMATSNGYIVPVDATERIERHPNFIVLAGANALSSDRAYTASTRLDASSLDRFATMRWNYCPLITARVAAESGSATAADWLVRLTDALRARIDAKGWRGECEWGTRTVARMASWLRSGTVRPDAVEMELECMPDNVASELRMVARGII